MKEAWSKIFVGVGLLLLSLGYLYRPAWILKLNMLGRTMLFNDVHVLHYRRRWGLPLFVAAAIFLFAGFNNLSQFHPQRPTELWLAYRSFLAHEYRQTIVQCEGIVAQDPDNSQAWSLMGSAWAALGKKDKAAQALNRGLALNQTDPDGRPRGGRKRTVKELLSEGRRLLAALRPPAGVQAELYLASGRSRQVGWGEGKPKDVLSSVSSGMSVRVIEGGRQGFAFANEVSRERSRSLFEQARAAAALMPRDPLRRLPPKAAAPPLRLPFDKSLFQTPVKTLQSRLSGHEAFLLAADPRIKKALALSFHEGEGAHAVINTRGVAVEDRSTSVSFSLEIMGEEGGETHVAWDWNDSLTWAALDVGTPLAGARDRLLRAFGAKSLPSGPYPVVFPPRVGVEVLSLAAAALSGEAVQKGRSFLAKKKGRAVASPLVTLVDDGRLPGGPASGRFDDEGVPARRNVLVSKGVLKGFYHDVYSAARAGCKSTGNGGRPGIKGAPGPEPTNFFMVPGRTSLKALMADTPRAFIVQDLLGMHTADPVTGDFSVGASGFLWEKGAVVQAVKGVTLAGSLPDLLNKVDAVAADLTWQGASGAPTFRVSGLSVGGS